MAQRIYDKIREILENTPGLTQKGLAERMGLNPAAVNRMLYGRRNIMAKEVPLIEDYLGVRLDLSGTVDEIEYSQSIRDDRRGFSDSAVQKFPMPSDMGQMVPVYGYTAGGITRGLNLAAGDVVDWVARHPAQFGIANAFAVYTVSDSMAPRYLRGELVYIHPGRPPEMNKDCLIEMKDGSAHIRRYLLQGDSYMRAAQLNPYQETDIRKEDIKAIYAVVGRG